MVWSESGEKSAQIKIRILMWETTGDGLFHWRKSYYGIWTFSRKLKMSCWICFSFCLLKMLTDGLEWCGLLWCFYQLFGCFLQMFIFKWTIPLRMYFCTENDCEFITSVFCMCILCLLVVVWSDLFPSIPAALCLDLKLHILCRPLYHDK